MDPSRVRTGVVRWTGRLIGALILAYLVLLGASLARAPWAPRLSLPGVGSVVAPDKATNPPHLGPEALTTPIPAAVTRAGRPGGSPGGATTGRNGLGPGASTSGSGITTTTAATTTTSSAPGNSGHSTSTTLKSTPGSTAPGRHATTTTTPGSVTTTTRAHGRGKP